MLSLMFLLYFGNCKVLNTTILINVARCLNNLIFPRFGNNSTVKFIFFSLCIYLIIFLRDVTRLVAFVPLLVLRRSLN